MTWTLIAADCVEAMRDMEPSSIDAVVTDPPYGLEFMGKEWDRLGDVRQPGDPTFHKSGAGPFDRATVRYGYDVPVAAMQAWHQTWAAEALRVLRPGGHLLSFGGTRTYHRLVCALEDAGFEIRDCLAWLYGSGFPKSLDVSKAIDKAAGAAREVVGPKADPRYRYASDKGFDKFSLQGKGYDDGTTLGKWDEEGLSDTVPATPDAERWQGWGTALKPAFEPIVLARKPLSGTVAENVLRHGTGALNVDGTRIEHGETLVGGTGTAGKHEGWDRPWMHDGTEREGYRSTAGRWPANVLLEADAAAALPESRFFYTAKTSRSERENGAAYGEDRNNHPTVKPVDLMQWLCRLVTPPQGVILDPFTGSGSTGIAALREGFSFIGIEREPDYVEIARARIIGDAPLWNVSAEV